MNKLSSIAVFCGAKSGSDPAYASAAADLGVAFAQRGIRLVYGGGRAGLMGVIADAAMANGGVVLGVITGSLEESETSHQGLTRLAVVETMHERKKMMSDGADGFVALPGGIGTLDEFCEALTWTQLGVHDRPAQKPCGLLNVNGYFDHLVLQLNHAVSEGFLSQKDRDLLHVDNDVSRLLDKMAGAPNESPS